MIRFRTRLAIGHFAAIVVVLTLTAAAGDWMLSRAVHDQLDAALLSLADAELGMLADDPQAVRVHEVTPGPAPPSFERLDRLVQIVDADGEVIARSANLGAARLPTPATLLNRLGNGEVVFETLAGYGGEPTRIVSVPVKGYGRIRAIQVAGSLDDVDHVVESAGVLFLVMGVSLVLAVVAAGALLTGRVFGAMDDLVREARHIGETHLNKRLPHPGIADEFGRLVDTLNDMLARLEDTFDAQRRFTADASHELRTPLSRLRTELEIALRRPRDPTDYVQTMTSCLEEVERLSLLVEELLLLARLDSNQVVSQVEEVSLDELVGDVVRRLEPTARDRSIELTLDVPTAIRALASRRLASLVLENLLDNAIKFSPPGGRVTIGLSSDGIHSLVRVADQGPGIRPDELPYVFERFFRGTTARARAMPGVGLGLALSQAIARAQGGTIDASNGTDGGASFVVRFVRA